MADDFITLPTGESMKAEEWGKLDPDTRNKIMAGAEKQALLLHPLNIANPNVKYPADNPNDPTMMQRLGMGGAMAIPGALTGGPLGAMAGFGSGFAFPPQNATDATVAGLGQFAAPIASKAEGLISGAGGGAKWLRQALRGVMGVTQEVGDDAIRYAGNQLNPQPGDQSPVNGAGLGVAAALPMLAGGVAERTLNAPKGKLWQAKQDVQSGANSIVGQTVNIGEGLNQEMGGAQASDAFNAVKQRLQQTVQQVPEAQQALQQKQAFEQQMQKVAYSAYQKLDQQKLQGLVLPQYSSDSDMAQRMALLSTSTKEQSKYKNFLQTLSSQDPDVQAVQSLQKQRDQVAATEPHPWMSQSDKDVQLKNIDENINSHLATAFQNKMDVIRKASDDAAQKLYDPTNAGVQRLQKAFDQVRDEANSNPLENVYLKNLTSPQGNSPATPQSFVGQLLSGDSQHIDALYKFLGTQKNGDQMISDVRDAMLTEFFAKAYDPRTKTLSNSAKLIAGDGPFNLDKVEAMFGGGVEGQDAAQKFSTLVSDLRTMSDSAAQAKAQGSMTDWKHMRLEYAATGLGGMVGGAIKGRIGAEAGAAVGGGAVTAIMGYPRLVDAVVNSQAFGNQFHQWASKGGSMDALKVAPLITSWINKNSVKY
jgi:hypothetical protein